MKYYLLYPEVAGNIDESEGDWEAHPPAIEKLHYEFDGWLGSGIVSSLASFIVTDALKSDLESLQPTGCEFDAVEVTVSGQFKELHSENLLRGLPNGESLPKFHWLKPTGSAMKDDFARTGQEHGFQLAVSERVWDIMQTHNMEYCECEEL